MGGLSGSAQNESFTRVRIRYHKSAPKKNGKQINIKFILPFSEKLFIRERTHILMISYLVYGNNRIHMYPKRLQVGIPLTDGIKNLRLPLE